MLRSEGHKYDYESPLNFLHPLFHNYLMINWVGYKENYFIYIYLSIKFTLNGMPITIISDMKFI